jgi:serine/threonine protein kinase
MLTIDDMSLLEDFEKAEIDDPSPTKIIDHVRTIYASRKFGLPQGILWGQPVLCDFGEARIGKSHKGLIQPELYRAPEVLFEMDWSSSVDIWTVGVLVSNLYPPHKLLFATEVGKSQIWDLFENRHLFNAMDENMESSATHFVAEMVAYLGLPPLEYIKRSNITQKVFDEQG